MLISMKADATDQQIEAVKNKIVAMTFTPHVLGGAQRVAIGITGNPGKIEPAHFLTMAGVADAIPVSKPFKLVGREFKPEGTRIDVGDHVIGGRALTIMAGPCSVESRESILEMADLLSELGIKFLRGGAFKPRTSPYVFWCLSQNLPQKLDPRIGTPHE